VNGARLAPGSGQANVATGVPVLDHLLVELAVAGDFDLSLEIQPDEPVAEVDAAGAALGAALSPLLRPRAHGTGTMLADEALAVVALAASSRPQLFSNADLSGAGGIGSDLAARFLGSLADAASLTMHVRLVEGEESDHVLEAIFKALGVALRAAVAE
jgi:imidazoleglycerol-phosphate dehydratase